MSPPGFEGVVGSGVVVVVVGVGVDDVVVVSRGADNVFVVFTVVLSVAPPANVVPGTITTAIRMIDTVVITTITERPSQTDMSLCCRRLYSNMVPITEL